MFAKLKKAYPEASAVEGYVELQAADKERFKSAWDEGHIPDDDKGPGEPAVLPKKAPVKRAKKDNGEPSKKRARKVKVSCSSDSESCARLKSWVVERRRGRRGRCRR